MEDFLITIFLGWAGVHKFMKKKTGMGVLYLLTFGLFGIGWVMDIIIAAKKICSSKEFQQPIPTPTKRDESPTPKDNPDVKVSNVDMRKFNKYKNCFIAFDLETTGINANKDKIIEMSAIKFKDFIPCEAFSTLVNPQMHIPASASKVNHIYDKDVSDAPIESLCMKDFCEFIGSECLNGEVALVAHNASFDAKFLSLALNRCNIENSIVYLDTLRFARKAGLGLENYKLGTLSTHFGIEQHSAHRAEDDARVCGELFVKLLELRKANK